MTLDASFTARRSEVFDVSIEIEVARGTTTALLGPNGSGKSTIVSVLAGLLAIEDGHIRIGDTLVDAPSEGVFLPVAQRHVGVVFQDYLLFDNMNVLENIAFGPRAAGRVAPDAKKIAQSLMEQFGLDGLADLYPPQLSGGQAQQVALARALAISPSLLLLDEPLAALDVATRSRFRRSLAAHLDSFDGARLLITHDAADAFLLAEQIVVLENGRVIQSGSAEEIRRHPATPYVAALSGRNLLQATNTGGVLTVDGSDQPLQTWDTASSGAVLVSIPPSAIAVYTEQPHGSPRNTWATTVSAIEPLGDTSRVYLGAPLELSADLTPGAVTSLRLEPGSSVWVSIKATEIDVSQA
jgi:molybdate transport system ATP-binding protein